MLNFRYPALESMHQLLEEYFEGTELENSFELLTRGISPYIAVNYHGEKIAHIYVSGKNKKYSLYWTDGSKEPNTPLKDTLFIVVHNMFEGSKDTIC